MDADTTADLAEPSPPLERPVLNRRITGSSFGHKSLGIPVDLASPLRRSPVDQLSPTEASGDTIPIALSPDLSSSNSGARALHETRTGRMERDDVPPVPNLPGQPLSVVSPLRDSLQPVKWNKVRELRASLKPSQRLPQPLPSPSIYDGGVSPVSPAPVDPPKAIKRKTLFQLALDGWWELPGILRKGDTVRVPKSKPRPYQARRKEAEKTGEDFV
ncbi:hypothetical protein GQ53DRAFT_831415 [Thozetella sp. PMI_491]|nr:hypothetical protein GQ53DRAFT_831415 [Thozetella sp. PMI_491]